MMLPLDLDDDELCLEGTAPDPVFVYDTMLRIGAYMGKVMEVIEEGALPKEMASALFAQACDDVTEAFTPTYH